jgi:hypothetical protein
MSIDGILGTDDTKVVFAESACPTLTDLPTDVIAKIAGLAGMNAAAQLTSVNRTAHTECKAVIIQDCKAEFSEEVHKVANYSKRVLNLDIKGYGPLSIKQATDGMSLENAESKKETTLSTLNEKIFKELIREHRYSEALDFIAIIPSETQRHSLHGQLCNIHLKAFRYPEASAIAKLLPQEKREEVSLNIVKALIAISTDEGGQDRLDEALSFGLESGSESVVAKTKSLVANGLVMLSRFSDAIDVINSVPAENMDDASYKSFLTELVYHDQYETAIEFVNKFEEPKKAEFLSFTSTKIAAMAHHYAVKMHQHDFSLNAYNKIPCPKIKYMTSESISQTMRDDCTAYLQEGKLDNAMELIKKIPDQITQSSTLRDYSRYIDCQVTSLLTAKAGDFDANRLKALECAQKQTGESSQYTYNLILCELDRQASDYLTGDKFEVLFSVITKIPESERNGDTIRSITNKVHSHFQSVLPALIAEGGIKRAYSLAAMIPDRAVRQEAVAEIEALVVETSVVSDLSKLLKFREAVDLANGLPGKLRDESSFVKKFKKAFGFTLETGDVRKSILTAIWLHFSKLWKNYTDKNDYKTAEIFIDLRFDKPAQVLDRALAYRYLAATAEKQGDTLEATRLSKIAKAFENQDNSFKTKNQILEQISA